MSEKPFERLPVPYVAEMIHLLVRRQNAQNSFLRFTRALADTLEPAYRAQVDIEGYIQNTWESDDIPNWIVVNQQMTFEALLILYALYERS